MTISPATLRFVLAADLGDFPLVQEAHPPKRFRSIEQPLRELADNLGRLVGPDETDCLGDLNAQIVLDAIEVVEENLP